ncbi:hypothetical protein QAD02_017713 [Eretmocerus hayati]|uniref:Uncharacterized protein n=1 Tax=Eretmocerus hayati TaxID=131215 RepID=A0ACC2PEL8_9HYME|nr:hypothetical protein QAD02_017713 [Eretmocerus hayati]
MCASQVLMDFLILLIWACFDKSRFLEWPRLAFIVLATAKLTALKGSRHKKDLKQIVSGNMAPDHLENIAIISLRHILGSVTCKMGPNSKDSWKTSVAQAQESFILHIEDYLKNKEGLARRTTDLKALFTKHDLPLNPYVVAVGKLDAIEHCYVVLNDFRYRIEGPKSLVRSVDICYKCTYTLQEQPPKPSSLAWQFLRKYVYGDLGDIGNSVTQLISDIGYRRLRPVPAPPKEGKEPSIIH